MQEGKMNRTVVTRAEAVLVAATYVARVVRHLLQTAMVSIANNSGPMHLAAAMGTPTVTIQGPTAPQWDVYWKDAAHVKICSNFPSCIPCERFGHVPGRCFNKVYPHGCLKEIDVGLVFHQVSAVLHNLSETKRSLNAS